MNNFLEHTLPFTTQGDADDVFQLPLNTKHGPLTLIAATVYLSAVAGSPTAVTLDIDLTDGTTTKNAITVGSIGTAPGQTTLEPTNADQLDGNHTAPQDPTPFWRAEVDFNFTGGTSPTVTGTLVLRFAH